MPSPPDLTEARNAMKVLVVEPDSGAREGLESWLEQRGHAVTCVAGADAALAAAEAERPSLLILDWTGAEGPRLCRRIRESEWGGRCVVLARGLRDRTADLQAALQAGADDYFANSTEAGRLEARLSLAEKRVREIEDRAEAEDEFQCLRRAVGEVLLDITGRREQALALAKIESELSRALRCRELRVHYQPIVSLVTRRVTGFEALLRWEHPERGLLASGEFMPAVEDRSLAVPIGYWLLREACAQVRAWQQAFASSPALTLSVALSRRQLAAPGLPARLQQILEDTGLPADSLRLEIAESVILEKRGSVRPVLDRLKGLGLQLDIGHFGSGESLLSFLPRFRVDSLKVDASQVTTQGRQPAVVKAIVALAHDLGISVLADQVESPDQASRLRALRCEEGQGVLFSRPIDARTAETLLEQSTDGVQGSWADPLTAAGTAS